jgi:hypothetical protein
VSLPQRKRARPQARQPSDGSIGVAIAAHAVVPLLPSSPMAARVTALIVRSPRVAPTAPRARTGLRVPTVPRTRSVRTVRRAAIVAIAEIGRTGAIAPIAIPN